MKQKVVIIGQGFTGRLSIARSVGQIGCEAVIIALVSYKKDGKTLRTHKPIDAYSKYVKDVFYCYSNDEQGLISILLEKCADNNQKAIIIPDNDFSAAVIDKHKDVLGDKFLFPRMISNNDYIIDWMDKRKQKTLAHNVGLNVLNSDLLELTNGTFTIPQNINYPCFVKPLASVVGGKSGLKMCPNEKTLYNHLKTIGIKYPNVKFLIEDFKNIETEYAVLGYADGSEVFIPGIIQILSIAHGGHFGVAIKGKIMPVDGFEEIIALFKKFVGSVGFKGIFDIDFFQSDGILYFGELNLRFGGSGYAYTKMGANFPAILVKNLKGVNTSDLMNEVRDTKTYVNERMCLDEWYSDYISLNSFKTIIESSDISFVKDKDDIAPYKAFKKEYNKRWIKKSIKKCLGLH